MTALMIVTMVLIGTIVLGLAIVLLTNRAKPKKHQIPNKRAKGYYLGFGMVLGVPIGFGISLPFGVAMDNIALGISIGPAIGAAFGIAFGLYMEKKNADKLRSLTPGEELAKGKALKITAAILGIGIMVLSVVFFFQLK